MEARTLFGHCTTVPRQEDCLQAGDDGRGERGGGIELSFLWGMESARLDSSSPRQLLVPSCQRSWIKYLVVNLQPWREVSRDRHMPDL